MKDLTGTRVGSYEIVERLGGGGMAVVYRAVQQPLGREVALKALSPELFQDDGFVKRFEAEAKTLAKLDHPNILPIYDFELAEGMAYSTVNAPIPSAAKLNAVLPDELDVLLAKVLAKDPSQRPQSVKDLLSQMAKLPQRRAATGAPAAAGAARPATASPPAPHPPDAAATRMMAPPPAPMHGSPPPTPSTGSSGGSSAIRTLQMMGVKPARARGRFILNSHVANLIHVARDVTGVRWPEIAYTAGLAQYLEQDPPNDEQLATPVEYLGRLNEAFETIYGAEAEDQLRAWGRRATERWLAEGRHGMGGPRRLVPGRQRKLAGIVKSFSEAMDNVRGEHTHAWLQVDEFQFWLVNFSNMFALGRIKTVKSCHVWVATIEAILRWAGLANDWYVEEVECGCVTGTFDCVFAIRSVET